MFKNEFITFQDTLYLIRKIIKEDHNPIIDTWKEHLGADIVLRKEGNLYFLQSVPDLEVVND